MDVNNCKHQIKKETTHYYLRRKDSKLNLPRAVLNNSTVKWTTLAFKRSHSGLRTTASNMTIFKMRMNILSVQSLSPTLCDRMSRSTPGLPVHQQLPEFTQTHAHRVGDAIQPFHPLSFPSPPAPNPSQHQGLFQ